MIYTVVQFLTLRCLSVAWILFYLHSSSFGQMVFFICLCLRSIITIPHELLCKPLLQAIAFGFHLFKICQSVTVNLSLFRGSYKLLAFLFLLCQLLKEIML